MPRNVPQLGYVLAIAGASMFAWLGPLSRWAEASGMEPLPFVAWRAGVGALILAVVVALRLLRNRAQTLAPPRELAVLGTATIVALVLNLAIFAAFARVPIAVALLAFYTYPAMIAAVAIVSGTERPSAGTILALILALTGMAVVVAGGFDPTAGSSIDPIGVALGLLAAASQTGFVTISRRGYPSIPADQAVTVILGGTFAGCVVIALLSGGATQLVMPFGQPPPLLLILVVAGSFGAAVPSLFFLAAIRLIGGMRTGILMLFEPVVAVTLAAILLHESIRPIQALGAVGVLGAALVLRRSSAGERGDRAVPDDDLFGVGLTGGP
jgi:drug/metabolite transporter, DME family